MVHPSVYLSFNLKRDREELEKNNMCCHAFNLIVSKRQEAFWRQKAEGRGQE
jgi:hypothetical protein